MQKETKNLFSLVNIFRDRLNVPYPGTIYIKFFNKLLKVGGCEIPEIYSQAERQMQSFTKAYGSDIHPGNQKVENMKLFSKDYSKIQEFKRIGFDYSKIYEDANYMAWQMKKDKHPHYSVEVWQNKAKTNPDGTIVYPAPSDEKFGSTAWFFTGKEEIVKSQIRKKFEICL